MTKRAAEQGSELVRRLLAFARRQKLEPQPIDLAALRDAVSDLLTHTLGGLVEIEWRLDEDLWNAFADQAQLELALVNLIINARDAMPAGGTVTVSAANRDARPATTSRTCRRAITSAWRSPTPAPGIAPDDLEKVHGAVLHHQGAGQGQRPWPQHGLWLRQAIERRVPDRQRARQGAPLPSCGCRGRRPASRAAAEPVAEPRQARRDAPSLRILLVDDHAEVRDTTAAVLEDFGHKVAQAANGADALEAAEGRQMRLRPRDQRLCDAATFQAPSSCGRCANSARASRR